MSATLAEREKVLCAGMSISDRAKRLAPKLGELSEQLNMQAVSAKTDGDRELADLFAEWCDQARDLLRILEQEQWRQREAIKLFLAGQIERSSLRNIANTWNQDPQP